MYDLILTGNKIVSITEEQKKQLDALLLNKDEYNQTVIIGRNTLKVSMIKGIFESGQQSYKPFDEKLQHDQNEWNEYCLRMSNWSVKDKTDNEITVRILPFLEANGVMIDESRMAVLRQTIEAFLSSHLRYPRCPSFVWWGVIKDMVGTDRMKWMEIVAINDLAIGDWVKYHGVKII